MKIKDLFLGAGISLILSSAALPALSQTTLKVGGKDLKILDMPIMLVPDRFGMPMMQLTPRTPDRRYKLLEVLPMPMTQELAVEKPPKAKRLYRVVRVLDRTTRREMQAAVEVRSQMSKR